jgi:two-component system nitrogen regulation response regulator NtrX
MISGHATIRTAVKAAARCPTRSSKPLDTDRILVMLRNALVNIDLKKEENEAPQAVDRVAVRDRRQNAGDAGADGEGRKVAATPARVLITGENGTGKGSSRGHCTECHRAPANRSSKSTAPAIPGADRERAVRSHEGLVHRAISDRAGKFEQANKGTLFLDEIGDMSLAAQAKVLRVLQDNVITRIGGAKPISVDVRVIAATNKESRARSPPAISGRTCTTGSTWCRSMWRRFERREDIRCSPSISRPRFFSPRGIPPHTLTSDALERLSSLDWPGNVRELRKHRRAVADSRPGEPDLGA